MKTTSISGFALSLCLAVAAFWASGAALAADDKTYPGNLCVKTSDSGTPSYDQGSIANFDALLPLTVECPIVRDSLTITRAWIRVTDRSTVDSVTCTLRTTAFFSGGPINTPISPQSSTNNSGSDTVEELYFPALAPNLKAHYYFRCTLPPLWGGLPSYIRTYSVLESP